MEPDQIIERIDAEDATLTVDELAAAKTELETAQSALKDQIKGWGGGTFEDLSALKADYDAVTDGLSKVVEALGAAQAQVQAIIDEVAGGEDAPAVENAEAEPVVEAEAEVTPVAASVRSTLARVRNRPEPTPEVTNTSNLETVRSTFVLNQREVDRPTSAQLGAAFADAARRFGGTKTVVASIKTELAPERTLSGDASANERKMLDLFGANPVVPVTASGGCCSIPEPIYDQPLIGSLDRPIRAAFDVLNASRGAVQAYPPVCLPDEGADVWTCTQDEAVTDDPDTWKSCTAIECEESDITLVEPIYKCLTIGTFQQKFAPEQWEAFLFQTDKLAARLAEARLFAWLVGASTSTYDSAFETGSTFSNFIKQQIRIAAAIRQDQRLGDAQLVTVGSNLIYSAIAEDTLTRRLAATEEVLFFKDRVDATLREFGITYVGSDDVANMTPFSYPGTIPAYPDEIPMVTLPAGSAKVLDGGEKNLGVDVPDLDTARRNEVAAFSEFWEGLLVRNCNVVYSTVEVESCDTVPCPE